MKDFFLAIPAIVSVLAVSSLGAPRIVSPDVQPDGHVIFRLQAPNALKVEVSIEGQGPNVAMQKDDNGVWTATAGPLQPDIYGYSFVADGVSLIDPSNPMMKPNLLSTQSAVQVPGGLPWDLSDIPHGEIHHHFYHSKIASDDRDFYVYTPPGYAENRKLQYPVLYLLHGFSDGADGWSAVGRANLILDNLISQGKAKPMIVVMPLGYGDIRVLGHEWGSVDSRELHRLNLAKFTDVVLAEVIPQTEGAYRVKKGREYRAIAGLSMGGAESLLTGLNHLDHFAWIGAFSAGGLEMAEFGAEFPTLDASANKKLKLLWIACGSDDDLIKVNRRFKVWLKEKGVEFADIETPGAHTWMVWRRNLATLAPLLFK